MMFKKYANDEYEDIFGYWNGKDGSDSCDVVVNAPEQFEAGLCDVNGNGTIMTAEEALDVNGANFTAIKTDSATVESDLKSFLGKNGFSVKRK